MFQSLLSWGRGVVTVGMVVVSDTRAPRFESCHRNIILHFLFTVNFKEKKIKRVQELPWLINKNILCTFHFNLHFENNFIANYLIFFDAVTWFKLLQNFLK